MLGREQSLLMGLFPVIAVVAANFSRRHPDWTRRAVRYVSVIMTGLLLCLGGSGFLQLIDGGFPFHRWVTHVTFVSVSVLVPFSFGVSLQQNLRQRTGLAIAQSLLVLCFWALMWLSFRSGYFGPSHLDGITEEERARFVALHMVALPGAAAILMLAWVWLFRPGVPAAPR